MKIKFILKKDCLYYVYLQRFVLYVNIATFLTICLMRIRIVKVKMYSFYLKESSNDKLEKHNQVSACLGQGQIDRRLRYIKAVISSFGDFSNI